MNSCKKIKDSLKARLIILYLFFLNSSFLIVLFGLIIYVPVDLIFSHVGSGLSELSHYLAADKVFCFRTQYSYSASGRLEPVRHGSSV